MKISIAYEGNFGNRRSATFEETKFVFNGVIETFVNCARQDGATTVHMYQVSENDNWKEEIHMGSWELSDSDIVQEIVEQSRNLLPNSGHNMDSWNEAVDAVIVNDGDRLIDVLSRYDMDVNYEHQDAEGNYQSLATYVIHTSFHSPRTIVTLLKTLKEFGLDFDMVHTNGWKGIVEGAEDYTLLESVQAIIDTKPEYSEVLEYLQAA